MLRLNRRHLLLTLNGAAGLAGCAPGRVDLLPETVRYVPPPQDRAATFRHFLRGEPFVPLSAPESPWLAFAEPPATVEAFPDALRLTSVPDRRAWASPRLPVAPPGAAIEGQVEELTWEATVTLTHRFFVICEVRFGGEPGAVLIQATPFDVQVFHDPDRPGGGASQSLSPLVGGGQPHYWRLRLAHGRTELRLDGSIIWTLPGARALARVAFGETRTDSLHGGTMELRDVVYVRRPVGERE